MGSNQYTHDLYGREVDDWYWCLLEESFEHHARTFRVYGKELAASIADQLAKPRMTCRPNSCRNFRTCGVA